MGKTISGWVEITTVPVSERQRDYVWQSLMNLGAFVGVCDPVSDLLFGFTHPSICGSPFVPVACERGLPTNPSWAVQRHLDWLKEHPEADVDFGQTYIYYDEVVSLDWAGYGVDPLTSNWWGVFELLDHFYRIDPRYGPDRTRIVAWVSW